jgi:hypothetical protein
MTADDDWRLPWDELDPLVLSGAKLAFIAKVREATGTGLSEAIELLRSRYDVLRRLRPADFSQTHEEYWDGFYS